ncbi:hypothetical protein SLS58_004311 [Diplodia intermedia]|uniref:Uncharacterized protein n=1 Tax=Diplodia intermedia TaxID=856260 RepID=A0ABR3TUB6_9PEZI
MATLLVQSGQPAHPACDLCYARKALERMSISPIGALVLVLTRSSDGKTESMINRLSRLESSVTRLATLLSKEKDVGEDEDPDSPNDQNDSATMKDTPASRSHAGSSPEQDAAGRPAKRVRLESPTTSETVPKAEASGEKESISCPVSKTPDHDFAMVTELEAQSFIRGELADASRSIGVDRRSVLESALEFIGQMEHPPAKRRAIDTNKCAVEISDCLIAPAPEFFHMILSGNQTRVQYHFMPLIAHPESQRMYPAAYDLEFSTYITRETLERMALALHNKSVDEQTLLQYSVCVNACAGTFLSHLPEYGESDTMQRALDKSKEDYLRRAINAMNYIGILATPSLALLQALLTGVSDLSED